VKTAKLSIVCIPPSTTRCLRRNAREQVDTLCSALERNRGGMVMKALKERGVGQTTILGQWWCKGLFFGGKACLYQGEDEEAVNCLRKGSKVRYRLGTHAGYVGERLFMQPPDETFICSLRKSIGCCACGCSSGSVVPRTSLFRSYRCSQGSSSSSHRQKRAASLTPSSTRNDCRCLTQLAKPAAVAKLRVDINNELEKATKRLASQTKKAQKMWTKVR